GRVSTSPFQKHIPAEQRAHTINKLARTGSADDRIHITEVVVVRQVENLHPEIGGVLEHGDRLVGHHVHRQERGERAGVRPALVQVWVVGRGGQESRASSPGGG